jgi:parallel beta-helix repeat protein
MTCVPDGPWNTAAARYVAAGFGLLLLGRLAAAPIVVTVNSTRDAGPGSLREALNAANRNGGQATIAFDIPKADPGFDAETGTWTITFRDTAPPLTVSHVSIDGSTQAARQGDTNPLGPEIVLSGNGHSVEQAFALLNASGCTIRGLAITQFIYGIQVYGDDAHDNRIVGNYLGCNAAGDAAQGNYNGIELISGAHDNQIGGAAARDGNLISGNQHIGVKISDAHRNLVLGNRIGLERNAMRPLPNYDGICIEGRAQGNRVGGTQPGERNLISGNMAYGVDLFGWGVRENVVLGNYIGTDHTGTQAVPNTYGVLFDDRASANTVGGRGAGEWNLISGNTAFGAYFYNNGTHANILCGNRIGTDFSVTRALPNETGVHIDGGTFENLVDGNLISGNLVAGITLFARRTDRNRIIRNHIGTDITGALALGNGADGVRIAFGPADNQIGGSPEEGNTIAHNGGYGVMLESGTGNRIVGNTIRNNARGDRRDPGAP